MIYRGKSRRSPSLTDRYINPIHHCALAIPQMSSPTPSSISENHVDVLIIGAGPAGVMACNALARNGVNVRIIDQRWVSLLSLIHHWELILEPFSQACEGGCGPSRWHTTQNDRGSPSTFLLDFPIANSS